MGKLLTKASILIIKIVITCSVILLAPGCSLFSKEEAALKPPLLKPITENIATYEVKKGTIINAVKGAGIFVPTHVAYYQFKESGGQIVEFKVKEGDMVKKGDVLVQLDIEGLDLELKSRHIELEKKKAALEEAKQLQDREQMKLRMIELQIAQMEYDNSLAKVSDQQLKAEMDGQVIYVAEKKQGDWINRYTVLVSVANMTQMRLAYQVNNVSEISGIKVGMEAEVNFKGKLTKGIVVQAPSSAPIVDNKQLQAQYASSLYIKLTELPEGAVFDTLADVSIVTEKRENTIVIPVKGLRSYFGRNYVQVIDGKNRTEVDVEKGIQSDKQIEILRGLEEGQVIILQ